MADERGQHFPPGDIPHPRCLVPGGGGDSRAVRTELRSWATGPIALPAAGNTGSSLSASVTIRLPPVLNCVLSAISSWPATVASIVSRVKSHTRAVFLGGGDDPHAVRAELRAPHPVLMAGERSQHFPAGRIPHPRGLVPEAVTIRVPSGLNCALSTAPAWPASVASAFPLAASHTRAVLSIEAVTIRVPSGLNCALTTASSWPASVASTFPLAASHTRAVLSYEAVTIRVPSGLNCALYTQPSWPASVASTFPLAASHTRAVLSS